MNIITSEDIKLLIKSNSSIMIGGFMGCGSPHKSIDAIVNSNINNIHLISSDTAREDFGSGKLISSGKVKSLIASHIGTNKETGKQMSEGGLEVTLVPQGTLAERIRAGGAGLGGILTPTGVGTDVQNGKEIIVVDGREYILEKPLRADFAIIYATYADSYGNLSFDGTTRNFNPIMALAAEVVIAEVEEILSHPINPNEVIIPSKVVNHIIKG